MTFLSKKTSKKSVTPSLSMEEREVLIGMFSLLLKVDKRNNPQNYS